MCLMCLHLISGICTGVIMDVKGQRGPQRQAYCIYRAQTFCTKVNTVSLTPNNLDLNTCISITCNASHKTGENTNKCHYLLHTC